VSNILQLWCIFGFLQLEYWKKIHRIHFESFDSKGFKCSYNSFSLKECKGMHKMMQLISKKLCKKNMLPFIQLHIHYVNLMEKKITWKFQILSILKQRATREMIPLSNILATCFIYVMLKIYSFRCMSHAQETIIWENMFIWF